MHTSESDLSLEHVLRLAEADSGPMRRLRRRYLIGIERLPMPMPALLDFDFYSPRATLLIDASLSGREAYGILFHQFTHLAQQRRRYRRSTHVGLCEAERIGGESAYFPWRDVDESLAKREIELPPAHKALLVHASPSCPGCRAQAGTLTWTYFVSPEETWRSLCGCSGWLAVCHHCREQVAFFLDRCN